MGRGRKSGHRCEPVCPAGAAVGFIRPAARCSRGWRLSGAAVVLALCIAAAPTRALLTQPEERVPGLVNFVYDGDTLRVRLETGENRRVRLIGVDAPESDDPREEVRLLAFLAKRFVSFRLNGKSVILSFDRERWDAYGRLLAYVWTGDDSLFNEVLIAEGYAFALLRFPFNPLLMKRFAEAERSARSSGLGLWRAGPFPEVEPAAVETAIGRVVCVRFECLRTFDRAGFRVLQPQRAGFEVLIPRSVLTAFPGPLDFEKRWILATGFVEEYKGRPQVLVGVPSQLRIIQAPGRRRRDPAESPPTDPKGPV
jgi:micrococcal nuclease